MALDLHPLYHTETMVRILREQGSSLHAMELAEIILSKQPDHQSVAQLLDEMKEEARASFERFRQAGRVEDMEEISVEGAEAGEESLVSGDRAEAETAAGESAVSEEPAPEEPPSVETTAEAEPSEGSGSSPEAADPTKELPDNVVALRDTNPPSPPPQVRLLETLLHRVQSYRKSHGR